MNTNPVATMNHLYAHLKTIMPQRRAKRGREDDVEERITKPKTLTGAPGESIDCQTSGTTQKPAPNQTT